MHGERSSEAPAHARGAYTHDGFYLRFGLGFAGFADALQSKAENADDEHAEGQINGVATVSELMIGGSLSPRWIIGGGLWTSTVLASDYRHTEGDAISQELQLPNNFTLIGPFADWYLSARTDVRQSGAFHLQMAAAFAVLNGLRPDEARYDDDRNVAVGGGVMVGFGYEWWIHEQWGMGALVRLTAAGLVEEDDQNATWYHGVAAFPAFMLTATFN